MKKIIYFAQICAYFPGVLGGFGWALYNHAYFIALAVLVLGIMALPQLKYCWNKLTE